MLLSVLVAHAFLQSDLPPLTVDAWLEGKARSQTLPATEWTDLGLIVTKPGSVPEIVDVETGHRTALFSNTDLERAYARRDQPLNQEKRGAFTYRLLQIDSQGHQGLFQLQWGKNSADLAVYDFATTRLTRIEIEPDSKNFEFSPDGRKVAYVCKSDLWVADLDVSSAVATGTDVRPKSLSFDVLGRRLTRTGTETLLNGTLNWVYWEEIFGRRDIGFWWSPDSKALAFLETDQSMITPTIFSDPREKDEAIIKQYYPKAGTPNPRARVGVIETAPPSVGGAYELPSPKWVGPSQGSYEWVLRVKWLPNSKDVAIITMNRPQTEVALTIAPREGGVGKTVLKESDDAYVNVTDDLVFLKGGSEFLWASERSGFYHLYRYDIDGKQLNAVTQGNWTLVSNPGPLFWVRQATSAVDEKNGWVYVTTNKDDSIERQLYRAKLDGTGMERITKERGVHGVSFSPDAHYFVDRYSNLETTPSLRLVDPIGNRTSALVAPDKAFATKYAAAVPKRVSITASDAVQMPGIVRYPRNFNAGKRYPAIIYCYGGPSAPSVLDTWHEPGWEQVLTDAGFVVFVFDNRSSMAVGKKQEAASLTRYMGSTELDDLVRASRWLKKQSYVDPGRVGVWGWSNGGTYTLLGMLRSDEFKAGIAVAAVVDHGLYDSKWAESMMKTPEVNKEGFEEVRLDRYAKNLHGRLLLVHGTYDDNVHPQQLWRMVDALVDANKQFDMLLYPMRKHGINDAPARRHLYTSMLEFWKRWL